MASFEPRLSFGIVSSRGFFEKLLTEYQFFDRDHVSPIHAINCALTSWHMTDWTFNEFVSPQGLFNDIEKEKMKDGRVFVFNISALRQYQDFVIKECPELRYMSLIANGSKHCVLRNSTVVGKTVKYDGDFAYQDFSRHDFDVDRLEIENSDGTKSDFEQLLLKTIEYWRQKLEDFESI